MNQPGGVISFIKKFLFQKQQKHKRKPTSGTMTRTESEREARASYRNACLNAPPPRKRTSRDHRQGSSQQGGNKKSRTSYPEVGRNPPRSPAEMEAANTLAIASRIGLPGRVPIGNQLQREGNTTLQAQTSDHTRVREGNTTLQAQPTEQTRVSVYCCYCQAMLNCF